MFSALNGGILEVGSDLKGIRLKRIRHTGLAHLPGCGYTHGRELFLQGRDEEKNAGGALCHQCKPTYRLSNESRWRERDSPSSIFIQELSSPVTAAFDSTSKQAKSREMSKNCKCGMKGASGHC